jgi:hypothetical protein
LVLDHQVNCCPLSHTLPWCAVLLKAQSNGANWLLLKLPKLWPKMTLFVLLSLSLSLSRSLSLPEVWTRGLILASILPLEPCPPALPFLFVS